MEVADQAQVTVGHVILQRLWPAGIVPGSLPVFVRQRKVVVDTGNGLHQAAVAVAKTVAVDFFHPRHIGAAVLGHRNAVVTIDNAGHAGGPQQLVAEFAVGEAVDVGQGLQAVFDAGVHRGNEFQQRLGIIGGDGGVGQRRTQSGRVRGLYQPSLRGDAQTFLFQSALYPLQQFSVTGPVQGLQLVLQMRGQAELLVGFAVTPGAPSAARAGPSLAAYCERVQISGHCGFAGYAAILTP